VYKAFTHTQVIYQLDQTSTAPQESLLTTPKDRVLSKKSIQVQEARDFYTIKKTNMQWDERVFGTVPQS
jgi:hypothetical protein